MSSESQRKYLKDMSISITGSDCLTMYPLYVPGRDAKAGEEKGRDEINCVDSYEMFCGPAQPFPYIEMSLKKQRLQTYYPALLEDLKLGRNIIRINAVGKDEFILTKIKTSGRTITITGYSPYEIMKSIAFPSSQTYVCKCEYKDGVLQYTPSMTSSIIESPVSLLIQCLTTGLGSISGIPLNFAPADIYISPGILRNVENKYDGSLMWISPTLKNQEGFGESGTFTLNIDSTLTVWQVITLCAVTMGAKVFFMDGKAYVIDDCDTALPQPYSIYLEEIPRINTSYDNPWEPCEHEYLTRKYKQPAYPTKSQLEFTDRILDVPQLGNEGVETVYNNVSVSANFADNSSATSYGSCTQPDVGRLDHADEYYKYRNYPRINGLDDVTRIRNQGSRNFFGTCTKTIDLPCYCTWSEDTEEKVALRGGTMNNPLTHLISAKQMMHLADAEQSIGFKMTEMGKSIDESESKTVEYRCNELFTDLDEKPLTITMELGDTLKLNAYWDKPTITHMIMCGLSEPLKIGGVEYNKEYSCMREKCSVKVYGSDDEPAKLSQLGTYTVKLKRHKEAYGIAIETREAKYPLTIIVEPPLEHSYWEPYYWMTITYDDTGEKYEIGPLARAKGFTDFVNETRITNRQNFGDLRELPGKLSLSKIVRNFPGMYSEYWFGIIEVCDLTAELSKILYRTV